MWGIRIFYSYTSTLLSVRVSQKKSILISGVAGKQEFRRTDFGSRLLAAESEGKGAVRVRGERTRVGEGEACV